MDRCKIKYTFLWILLIIVLLLFGKVFAYLYAEFISNSHAYTHDQVPPRCPPSGHRDIPKVIHQVMFNRSIPKPYLDAREQCNRLNKGFVSILWNKTMVDQLVRTHYPFIHSLFDSYDIWVKRADVARYLVIHHHGGIYIDMDTNCTGR